MKLRKLVTSTTLAGAAFLFTAFASRDAHALGPVDLEVAARVGTGTAPSDAYTNPFGLGFGARAGVSFLGLYGGVSVIDYLGSTTNGVSQHALMYGLEAGFGLKIAILTIRPQIGFGSLGVTTSADVTVGGLTASNSNSDSYFYLEPGLVGLVSLGDTWFVGADVNALVVPGVKTFSATTLSQDTKTETSVTIHGQVGVRF